MQEWGTNLVTLALSRPPSKCVAVTGAGRWFVPTAPARPLMMTPAWFATTASLNGSAMGLTKDHVQYGTHPVPMLPVDANNTVSRRRHSMRMTCTPAVYIIQNTDPGAKHTSTVGAPNREVKGRHRTMAVAHHRAPQHNRRPSSNPNSGRSSGGKNNKHSS